ncbi:MAG: DUF4032 domain-containing protein [Thermoflexales bacterium]|nr:DUF4032 domain-containing protein [Thermoflexales bacterium]MDW8291777.1 DUF4032 domain-containing protein [Anaerolineae bacterium]
MTPSQDALEFRKARAKSRLRCMWARLVRRNTALLSWDEARAKLHVRSFIHRGVQAVPLQHIVGSVGRYRDFDNAFLPLHDHTFERWRRINQAFDHDVNLPPVQLYKVGDVYFVLDGNHRISVAREHGAAFIDAEVLEAVMRVPVTLNDANPEALALLGEYDEFLRRTRLDVLRPEQDIRFSTCGGYARVLEHIAAHRYFMGIEQKRAVSEEEAVTDWYDNVYLPVVEAIRKEKLLADFPGRTEADLYLWVVEHLHYLREAYGRDLPPEVAAHSFASQFGKRPWSAWMHNAADQLLRWLRHLLHRAGATDRQAAAAASPADSPAGWAMAASR